MGIFPEIFYKDKNKHLYYQKIINKSRDIILIIDNNFKIVDINKMALNCIGVSKKEALGKSVSFIMKKCKPDIDVFKFIKHALAGKKIENQKVRLERNNNMYYLKLDAERIVDDLGNSQGVLLSAKDETNIIQQNKKINDKNIDLAIIQSINKKIIQGESINNILNFISMKYQELIGTNRVALYYFEEKDNCLGLQGKFLDNKQVTAIEKIVKFKLTNIKMKLKSNYEYTKIIESKKPVLIDDKKRILKLMSEFTENKSIRYLVPFIDKILNFKSMIVVPLMVEGRLIGVIDTSSCRKLNKIEFERIARIGSQLAIALDRRIAREKLNNALQWSDKLIKLAPNLVIGLGEGSKIKIFNKYAEEITGYKANEVIGKKWIEIFIPRSDRKQLYKVWDDIVKNKKKHHHYENSIICKNKTEKLISWNNSIVDSDRKFGMVLSIGEDITDRKKADRELVKSENRLRDIADTIEDVFWITRWKDKQIIYVTKTFEKIWGYKREELYNKPHLWAKTIVSDNKNEVLKKYLKLGKKEKYDQVYQIKCKCGEKRWIRDRGYPIIDKNGSVTRVVGVAQDITKLYESQQNLKKANIELKSVERLRSLLLRDISHELKTPNANLQMILNMIDIEMKKKKIISKNIENFMELAQENLNRSLEQVNNVLGLSELKSLEKYKISRVNMRELVYEVASEYTGKSILKGLKLKIVDGENCYVCANRNMLKSVIKNLIDNAIKFSDKGTIMVTCKKIDASIIIEVKDEGIGIKKNDLPKLFKAFSKLNPSKEGLGLGLSIIKKIVEMNQGEIKVKSIYKKGSRFIIKLPASRRKICK